MHKKDYSKLFDHLRKKQKKVYRRLAVEFNGEIVSIVKALKMPNIPDKQKTLLERRSKEIFFEIKLFIIDDVDLGLDYWLAMNQYIRKMNNLADRYADDLFFSDPEDQAYFNRLKNKEK